MEYQGQSEYNDELHYDHKGIESAWQAKWEEEGIFNASDDKTLPKYFPLIEFPYPSGQGLHVGHPRPYTALDIVARKRRMQGYNVLYPIGWDAFGLPTENYAIKNKIHPKKVTENNIKRFKSQLKSLGISFDWSREINTTDPGYYKWTQWIFLKLFEKGLAYKKKSPINWCTDCKVGLANEEVVGGVCERCGGEVVRRVRTQWMLKITEYAERLINDLGQLDFIERVKVQQINWIGRSEGMEVDFKISMLNGSYPCDSPKIRVFTTRPDTLFGATYMVLSPEHPFIDQFAASIRNWVEVGAYREAASHKSDFERTEMVKDKTGVWLNGLNAVNPVTGREIPIWISDYVLVSYGTGAIMAVPGHDDRDWEFAKKFRLPVVEVVAGGDIVKKAYTDIESGVMINSGFITGMQVKDAITAISDWLEAEGLGTKKVNYKLRDWVFSRQRYWGEPIPLVFCEHCGWVPIPESELPLLLPEVEYYVPTDTGESPLAKLTDWVNTTCPSCGGPGLRETDTMPQWAGSSWYFLRYTDPRNDKAFASREALDYWTPVDWYNGGMEHTTLHLLYSRFWHKFLFDLGLVPTSEPYSKRTSHGMIMGENNEKMSKSRGNVVNPDDIIDEFGADTLRLYEMFIGDFEKSVPWSQNGVKGCRRFLDRVWRMQGMIAASAAVDGTYIAGTAADGIDAAGTAVAQPQSRFSGDMEVKMHRTIKKVSEDFESMKFNTAIAALMTLVNDFYSKGNIITEEFKTFLILLNPVAPHISEELWQKLGFDGRVCKSGWPVWDEAKTVEDMIEIAIQINGKVKERIFVPSGLDKTQTEEKTLSDNKVQLLLTGKSIVKVVGVPGKIVNIVIKS